MTLVVAAGLFLDDEWWAAVILVRKRGGVLWACGVFGSVGKVRETRIMVLVVAGD